MWRDGFNPVFNLVAAQFAVDLMQVLEEERNVLFVCESCKETVVQNIILYNEFQGDVAFWDVELHGFLVTSGDVPCDGAKDILTVHFDGQRLVEADMKRQFLRIVVVEIGNGFDRAVVNATEGVVDIDKAVGVCGDVKWAVSFLGRAALDERSFPVAEE